MRQRGGVFKNEIRINKKENREMNCIKKEIKNRLPKAKDLKNISKVMLAHNIDILKDELSNFMEQICSKNITELKSQKVVLEDSFELKNFNLK